MDMLIAPPPQGLHGGSGGSSTAVQQVEHTFNQYQSPPVDSPEYGRADMSSVRVLWSEMDAYQVWGAQLSNAMVRLPTLYKTSSAGITKVWVIGWNGNYLVTNHGELGGTRMDKFRPVVTNQHSKSLLHQVLQEMLQRYKKKTVQQRYLTRSEWMTSGTPTEPMLANIYHKLKANAQGEQRATNTLKHGAVLIQPKADGSRADVFIGGNGAVSVNTRLGNPYHWLTELRQELQQLFEFLPRNWHLDGELFHPTMTFQAIMAAVRTENHEHPDNHKLMFMWFDINDLVPTPERMAALPASQDATDYRLSSEQRTVIMTTALQQCTQQYGAPRHIWLMPTYQVVNQYEVIDSVMKWFCNGLLLPGPDGNSYFIEFEGLMIRKMASTGYPHKECVYRQGRSSNLLKMKPYMDAECVIVGMEAEMTGSQDLAKFIVRYVTDLTAYRKAQAQANQQTLQYPQFPGLGVWFKLRPKGTEAERRHWYQQYLQQPAIYVGSIYTFKYEDFTPDGYPRNPVGHRWYTA